MALLLKWVHQNYFLSMNATKTLLTVPSVLNTNAVYASKINNILKKLGFAERPKRPLSGFLKFAADIRPTINAKNIQEASAQISLRWKDLDQIQKAKYKQEFDEENVEYKQKIAAYNQNLTEEQRLAIQLEKNNIFTHKYLLQERRKHQRRLIDLGKPKKPPNAFILFRIEENKKSPTGSNLQEVRSKYANLSEARKEIFKRRANVLMEQYKRELQAWEDKMLREENFDVVRKKSIANAKEKGDKSDKKE